MKCLVYNPLNVVPQLKNQTGYPGNFTVYLCKLMTQMSGARLLLNKVTVHHFLLNDSLLDNLHRRDIFILMGSMLLHLFRLGLISVHGVCLEVVLLHLKKRLHNFTCFLLYKSMMKRIGVFGLRTRNFIGEFRMLSVCMILLVCRPDRWYCRN